MIEQPYKNFNNVQRAAVDRMEEKCKLFLEAASVYFRQPEAKHNYLLSALKTFLTNY